MKCPSCGKESQALIAYRDGAQNVTNTCPVCYKKDLRKGNVHGQPGLITGPKRPRDPRPVDYDFGDDTG